MAKLSGAVVYHGPSQLNKRVMILGIVTGLDGSSDNPKTGPMAQLWILRSDMPPSQAVVARVDDAICGDCGLRGTGFKDRGCYVGVVNAPGSVYRKWQSGGYETRNPGEVNALLWANQLPIRLGAYGDPLALPAWVLRDLTWGIRWTGYTHAWKQPRAAAYQGLLMASADSPSDQQLAAAQGWRTFRTRAPEQPLMPGEIICPASDEAGKRTTCSACELCNGVKPGDARKSIVIQAHGATTSAALLFIRSRALLQVQVQEQPA